MAVIGITKRLPPINIRRRKESRRVSQECETGEGEEYGIARGDIRTVTVIAFYLLMSVGYILLTGLLLDWDFQGSYLLYVLIFFAVFYAPLPRM